VNCDFNKENILFVYGTLLRGLPRSHLLEDRPFLWPAILHQADLYDLGGYPGVKDGSGIVVGELLRVDDRKIKSLDTVEGYVPEDDHKSLFIRMEKQVRVLADGRSVMAFCYIYNRNVGRETIISQGDYRRFLIERKEDLLWIAAYGSNLDKKQLAQRVGELGAWKTGVIPGYRLVFNKKSQKGPVVYANISYVGGEEKCPAVAYRLTRKQAERLDTFEGGYIRMCLPFAAGTGETFYIQGYVALPEWLTEGRSPEPGYLEHLETGYREYGLDTNFLVRALAG